MIKNKKIMLFILGILGLIVITAGVTYAFFNYAKQGTTENSITTGTITFLYTEVSGVGRGISIDDAYPISDEVGKVQTGEGKVFDFKVTSTTMNESNISYEVTARKKADSTLDESAVKLYLTKVSGDIEEEVLLDNYSNLTQTTKVSADKYTEKTIYTDKVYAGTTNYEQAFRLRMWIDDSIDFSPVKDENGNDTYLYNGKTFTVTVNVYANAKVITDEEIDLENTTAISTVTAGETEATIIENQNYDYYSEVDNEVSEVTIDVETLNEEATVEITKADDSVTLSNTSIKRMSTTKTVTMSVEEGDNYFNIKVTSANKKESKNYILNIYRVPPCQYVSGAEWSFEYQGASEEFKAPCAGTYKLEAYGAGSDDGHGGLGSYATGTLSLSRNDSLYVYVGETYNSFNGGGNGVETVTQKSPNGGHTSTADATVGSGATDFRIIPSTSEDGWSGEESLLSRIVTAGGGAGYGKGLRTGRDYRCSLVNGVYTGASYIWFDGNEWVYTTATEVEESNEVLAKGSAATVSFQLKGDYACCTGATTSCFTPDYVMPSLAASGGGGYYGGTNNNAGTSLVQNYTTGQKEYILTDTSTELSKNNSTGYAKIIYLGN